MINPKAYDEYLVALDDLMARGRALGLYRTAERVHEALKKARSERHEAAPRNPVTIEFQIGPVREQTLNPKETK